MDQDERVIAQALVAIRRAAACESLPDHSRSALSATARMLERYASRRGTLRGYPQEGGE